MGYVAGGLLAGAAADVVSFEAAIALVAGLTAVSGLWVWLELPLRNVPARSPTHPVTGTPADLR